jgi:isopenicillin-N N-acyltransferase-like protein
MKVYKFKGESKEIGVQIGEEFRKEINEFAELVENRIGDIISKGRPFKGLVAEFNENTGFYNKLLKTQPGLMDEIAGMAEASGVDIEAIFAVNCLDELMSYSMKRDINEKCSCIGIKRRDNNEIFISQNMDAFTIMDGYQILMQIQEKGSDVEQLIFTVPGLLAFNGVNNRSVGTVVNSLSMAESCYDGIPVSMIIRNILKKKTADEASQYVRTVKHASGQNYIIADKREIYSMECSSRSVIQLNKSRNKFFDYVCHTNHPIENEDIIMSMAERFKEAPSIFISTYMRLETIKDYLSNANKYFTEKDLMSILSSHENGINCICRHDDTDPARKGFMTVGSIVMKLDEEVKVFFSKGPGCVNEYEEYSFQ